MFRTIRASAPALAISVAIALTALSARADFDAGLAAYQAGDFATARSLWLPLAEQGDPAAQRNLALILLQPGPNRIPSAVQAVHWLQKSAEAGFARAHYDLAYLRFQGLGLKADPKLAAEHMQTAARLGLGDAQHDLAVLFEQGVGVDKNENLAVIWYRRAVQSGFRPARAKLARLTAIRNSRTVEDGGDFAPVKLADDVAGNGADNGAGDVTALPGEAVPADATAGTDSIQPESPPAPATPETPGTVAGKAPAGAKNTDVFQHLVKIFQAE